MKRFKVALKVDNGAFVEKDRYLLKECPVKIERKKIFKRSPKNETEKVFDFKGDLLDLRLLTNMKFNLKNSDEGDVLHRFYFKWVSILSLKK